jgi:hypothetical protein
MTRLDYTVDKPAEQKDLMMTTDYQNTNMIMQQPSQSVQVKPQNVNIQPQTTGGVKLNG